MRGDATVKTTIYLTEDLSARIESVTSRTGIGMAALIRQCIDRSLPAFERLADGLDDDGGRKGRLAR